MRFLLFVLFCSFYTNLLAQRDDSPATLYEENRDNLQKNTVSLPRKTIALSGALLFPQGDYSTKGYAKMGYGLALDLSVPVYKNWCVGLAAKYFKNPVTAQAGHERLLPLLLNGSAPAFTYYNAADVNYDWQHLLAGANAGLSFVEKKTTFDMRIMGGVLYTAAQAQSLSGSYAQPNAAPTNFVFEQKKSAHISPALGFSLALSHPIWKRWGAFAKASYISANLSFEQDIYVATDNYTLQSNGTVTMPFQVFALQLGLNYSWGRIKMIE
jgi:hypothetical protein